MKDVVILEVKIVIISVCNYTNWLFHVFSVVWIDFAMTASTNIFNRPVKKVQKKNALAVAIIRTIEKSGSIFSLLTLNVWIYEWIIFKWIISLAFL
jgi:hypothetical protein